jgi:hypothetical protein
MRARTILRRTATACAVAASILCMATETAQAQARQDPTRDYVSPFTRSTAIVTCPPPTKSTNATNPTGSDC